MLCAPDLQTKKGRRLKDKTGFGMDAKKARSAACLSLMCTRKGENAVLLCGIVWCGVVWYGMVWGNLPSAVL